MTTWTGSQDLWFPSYLCKAACGEYRKIIDQEKKTSCCLWRCIDAIIFLLYRTAWRWKEKWKSELSSPLTNDVIERVKKYGLPRWCKQSHDVSYCLTFKELVPVVAGANHALVGSRRKQVNCCVLYIRFLLAVYLVSMESRHCESIYSWLPNFVTLN